MNVNKLQQLLPDDLASLEIMNERAMLLAEEAAVTNNERIVETGYVKFIAGNNECYGIPFQDIEDVKIAGAITRLPKTREYVAGIIYWHGRLIPVIDMTIFLKIPTNKLPETNKVITTLRYGKNIVALLFNDVIGVDTYSANALDVNLPINDNFKDSYILGVHAGKSAILNVENVIDDLSKELMSTKNEPY